MNLDSIASLITSNKGGIISKVSGAVGFAITKLVTSWGMEMPEEVSNWISTTAGIGIYALLENWARRRLNKSMTQIQDALPGINVTGGASPDGKTVNAVKSLVAANDGPNGALPVPPMSIEESGKITSLLPQVMQENPALLHAVRATISTMEKAGALQAAA